MIPSAGDAERAVDLFEETGAARAGGGGQDGRFHHARQLLGNSSILGEVNHRGQRFRDGAGDLRLTVLLRPWRESGSVACSTGNGVLPIGKFEGRLKQTMRH